MAAAAPAPPRILGEARPVPAAPPVPLQGRSGMLWAAFGRFFVHLSRHLSKKTKVEKYWLRTVPEVMESLCREATVKAIERALPREIAGLSKIHPPRSGNLWMVSYNCPNPTCECAVGKPKDKAHKQWTKSALAQAVLSKHRACFDILRSEDCGEEQGSVDNEKSLAIAEYVLQDKQRKIQELELEVHVHP